MPAAGSTRSGSGSSRAPTRARRSRSPQLGGQTYRLHQAGRRRLDARSTRTPQQLAAARRRERPLAGFALTNVAPSVGLDFRQGSFRFGMSNDTKAMMGGGVCWLDYNGDGWLDLFAVNSYSSADTARWEAHGGLPRTALFENVHGTFRNVSGAAHADLPVQGDGCVAADLNGDGQHRPRRHDDDRRRAALEHRPRHVHRGAQAAASTLGWYTGAAVADVNGDGRPDLFVAGYADPNSRSRARSPASRRTIAGVRDLLYLNEGRRHARFREVGDQAGPRGGAAAATGSARCSPTSTATAGPISTSRTTRTRTSST